MVSSEQVSLSAKGHIWIPPPAGWIKVNSDASTGPKEEGGAIGWIVRDDKGGIIEAGSHRYPGLTDIATLEAVGIRDAILWVKANCTSKIIMENDNKDIIALLRSQDTSNVRFGKILSEIIGVAKDLQFVGFNFTPRSGNRAADCLAKKALLKIRL